MTTQPSATPRTDAAYFANGATMYSIAGEMKLMERELSVAQSMQSLACRKLDEAEKQLAAARAVEHAEKEANAKLALYRSRVFRAKSILSYIEDDGTEQHHSATPERKEGEQ